MTGSNSFDISEVEKMKTNYQSNSKKSKINTVEDKNKVDKFVKGKVKIKKKNSDK